MRLKFLSIDLETTNKQSDSERTNAAAPTCLVDRRGTSARHSILMIVRLNRLLSALRLTPRAALILLIVLIALLLGYRQALDLRFENVQKQTRASFEHELQSYAFTLGSEIDSGLDKLQALGAFIEVKTDDPAFAKDLGYFASGLAAGKGGLQSYSIAPRGLVAWVFPAAGNQALLGHHLLEDVSPEVLLEVQRALTRGEVTVTRLYRLPEDQLVIRGLQSVFVGDSFWGLLATTIKLPGELEGIADHLRLDGRLLALRDPELGVIWGSAAAFDHDPVTTLIDLPDRSWELGLAPISGWTALINAQMRAFRGAMMLIMILLVLGTYAVLARQTSLMETIARQTDSLQTELKERKRAQAELTSIRDNLEELVASRTRQLQELQGQLIRKERQSLLGEIAGWIGHELRNPLAAIGASAYYLGQAVADPSETIQRNLEILSSEVWASEKIIASLLNFARPTRTERQHFAVSELIAKALEKARPEENIELGIARLEGLPAVEIDPLQVEQALVYLLAYAFQAMPEGGRLEINAIQENSLVKILISQSGGALPEALRQQLFETYANTGPYGDGLGLAIAQKIVLANGGRIEIKNRDGSGSTFEVYLPCAPGSGGSSS